jgi:hypothetical protein
VCSISPGEITPVHLTTQKSSLGRGTALARVASERKMIFGKGSMQYNVELRDSLEESWVVVILRIYFEVLCQKMVDHLSYQCPM